MTDTRIQHRGNCAICGNDQAVKDGRMSNHGYTVEWNHFNDACYGSKEVHYGHKDAPAVIQKAIDNLNTFLVERMPSLLAQAKKDLKDLRADKEVLSFDLHRAKSRITSLIFQIEKGIPAELSRLAERKESWKPNDTYILDVEKIAAEERARKQAERDAKVAAKEKAENEKAARIKEREARALAKVQILLANQWRQVEVNGEIVLEWQSSYAREGDYWRDMGNKLVEYFIEQTISGKLSVEDYYDKPYKIFFRSRTGEGKKGKQIDRFAGMGLPIHRVMEDDRIKKIFEQRKKES